MPEDTSTTSTETADESTEESAQTAPETTEDSTDWKAEARKWEQRAKENGAKASEFDKARKAAMTDAERAVSEAEERGRTAASQEFGKELAREKFDALAGRRNKDFDTAQALEFVDLAKFLGEDGRPNVKAIEDAVTRLVPETAGGPPSFDGGTRTTVQGGDFNQELRRAAGRA